MFNNKGLRGTFLFLLPVFLLLTTTYSVSWSINFKPDNSMVVVNNPTFTETILLAGLASEYIMTLEVDDGFVNSGPSNLTINENEPLIDIDGRFIDWDNLPENMFATYMDAQGDSSSCQTDIRHLSVCNDETNVYFEMGFSCDLPNPIWDGTDYYQIWIDVDQDPTTGFNGWDTTIGAEYVWENGDLYEHVGGINDWSWTNLGRSDFSIGVSDASRIEVAIPCSAIGMLACQPYLNENGPLRFVVSVMSSSSFLDMSPDDPTSDFHQWLAAVEVIMELSAGWSMISLPVRPNLATVTALFPEAVVLYKYHREKGYLQVQSGENLEVGKGYWILLEKPKSYTLKGSSIIEYTMSAEDHWYMIGGCSYPAQKIIKDGSIDVIYSYTQGIGYQRIPDSEPLEPGKGYWILFNNTSDESEFTANASATK